MAATRRKAAPEDSERLRRAREAWRSLTPADVEELQRSLQERKLQRKVRRDLRRESLQPTRH